LSSFIVHRRTPSERHILPAHLSRTHAPSTREHVLCARPSIANSFTPRGAAYIGAVVHAVVYEEQEPQPKHEQHYNDNPLFLAARTDTASLKAAHVVATVVVLSLGGDGLGVVRRRQDRLVVVRRRHDRLVACVPRAARLDVALHLLGRPRARILPLAPRGAMHSKSRVDAVVGFGPGPMADQPVQCRSHLAQRGPMSPALAGPRVVPHRFWRTADAFCT
jgi:hypothetical protein